MDFIARSSSRRFLLGVIFLIGFAALIYEIYSVQILFMFFVNNTHAAAIAISAFLAGLAASSIVFSWYVRDIQRNLSIIFWMQLAAALYGYFILQRVDLVPYLLDVIHTHVQSLHLIELMKVGLVWVFLFVPAFFIGGALPLINGLYLTHHETGTRDTGVVYFWDMFGAILGALITGFYLLPHLGVHWTALIAIGINLLVCLLCVRQRLHAFFVGIVIIALGYLSLGTPTTIPHAVSTIDSRFGKILFQKESPYGRITVGEANPSMRQLFINYRVMCQSTSGRLSEGLLGVILSANARAAHHKSAPRALNIGLGCGTTASRLAFGNSFFHLDIVEINPVVKEVAEGYFYKANNNVVKAPHVRTIIENGAEYIRSTDLLYDAIAIDIEEVNIIYSSPLYTKEYFEIAQKRLAPKGALGLWSLEVNDDFSKVMYNTLASVFKYVEVYPVYGASLYFASDSPMIPLPPLTSENVARQQRILKNPNKGINTLERRLLEKYYNANHIFGLPDDYREPFFIDRQQDK